MRWNTYSEYLNRRYSKKLYRIGVDGGFSCPNRCKNGSGGCTYCDGSGSVAVYQRGEEKGRNLPQVHLARHGRDAGPIGASSWRTHWLCGGEGPRRKATAPAGIQAQAVEAAWSQGVCA